MKFIVLLLGIVGSFVPAIPKSKIAARSGALGREPRRTAVRIVGDRSSFSPDKSAVFEPIRSRSRSAEDDGKLMTMVSTESRFSNPLVIDTSSGEESEADFCRVRHGEKREKRFEIFDEFHDPDASIADMYKVMEPILREKGLWTKYSTFAKYLSCYRTDRKIARRWMPFPQDQKKFLEEYIRQNPSSKPMDGYRALVLEFGSNDVVSQDRIGNIWKVTNDKIKALKHT